jgi:hypothetical protein
MLEHSQLAALRAGRNDPLWICSIPERARRHLGCSTGAVYLSRQSAEHILSGHNDIDSFDLLLLPVAVTRGYLLAEIGNPRFLNAAYDLKDGRIYFVPMKTAAGGHELWVSSMYRLTPRKLAKKLSRAVIV